MMSGHQPTLRIDQLSVEIDNLPPVVDAIDLTVDPGEIVAIVGESGSGKTLAARAILDLLPPGVYRTGGRVQFEGEELTTLPEESLRRIRGGRIGMVFQEPMVSLNPSITIGEQMMEGLRLHRRLDREAARAAAISMLARIQIRNPERCLSAYPHEFSGGMRQRIMLASVMLLKPALLIADEPTTALDTLVQRDVLDLMVDLCREHGTAILMISHDLAMVARYAHRVAVMQRGRIVEQGETNAILLTPQHDYTKRLLDALPKRGPARHLAPVAPLVELRDLVVDYPGRRRLFSRAAPKRAVDGVSLEIMPGETVALVGASGSGKTTLGRCLAGLIRASSGEVRYRGAPTTGGDGGRAFRLDCQMVFQDPYSSLDPRMRVGEIIAEPLRHAPDLDPAQRRARVDEVIAEIGLSPDHARRYPHQLSGGQRQRVAIGRAIVRRPALVIADEPVSALDMTVQKQILELLDRLRAQYAFACLFISHDLGVVEQIADRVLVMEEGKLVEQGSRDDIFDRPQHAYTRRLLEASPSLRLSDGAYVLEKRHRAIA